MTHPYPTESLWLLDFYSNDYDAILGTTTSFCTMFNATNKSFIYFHIARQWFAVRTNHRHPVTLQ